MRVGVRARGTTLDEAQVERARTKLRWALGRHAAAVRGAHVYIVASDKATCRVRLRLLDGGALEAEVEEPGLDSAIDHAIERAAAAVARAVDTARVWDR